jgi:hypothetical protein
MKGSEFLDALRDAVAPAAISSVTGSSTGVAIKLSDGRTIKAERKAIAELNSDDDMAAYVKRVVR